MEKVLRELVKLAKTDKFNGELDYGGMGFLNKQ